MEKKKIKRPNLNNWMENNNVVKIVSIVAAAAIWVIVAMTFGRELFSTTMSNVPVDISLQSATFADLGLNPIEVSHATVSVTVEGDRLAIIERKPEDFIATADPSIDVTEPDTYTVRLVPAGKFDSETYTSITYSPATVQVKFDRLVRKNFAITPVIRGLTMAPDLIQASETLSPSQVSIRGPQAEIDKIDRCVVEVDLDAPLERTWSADLPIKLLDASGAEMDPELHHLTVDAEQARLVIEILQMTSLDLTVGFTRIPRGFQIDDLLYRLSTEYIELAGPVDIIGRDTEIRVGYIDLSTVTRANSAFVFELEVPSEYRNLDNLSSVTVEFDTAGWEQTSYTVRDLQLINVPAQYDVSIIRGATLYDVAFTGEREALALLTSEDIVGEIDLSERELAPGQYDLPVRISAPGKGLVWATGDYTAVVQISEK